MARVRLGIVGCGVIGNAHLRATRDCPLIELVAVADLAKERAEAAVQEYGAGKAYAEGKELIADPDVDAVVLATPAAYRDELAVEALQAGKHVLIEKPVAMNAANVERMIEARGDRVAACCSPRYRTYESARVAAEFMAGGALGELRVLHVRVHQPARGTPRKSPPPWRISKSMNGGGILMNWGCYDLDFMLSLTGWTLKPRLCLAQTWPVPPRMVPNVPEGSDAETHYAALIRCEGGTVISMERGEYMPAHEQMQWQIVGSHGSLNMTMVPWRSRTMTHDDTTTEDGVTTRTLWESEEPEARGKQMVVDFAEAIVEGREPLTNLERALVIQKISDAIYASAETGKAVEIN